MNLRVGSNAQNMSLQTSKIIYKYRDWRNEVHRKLLTDRELFASSPKDFNDPFDCRISPNLDLLDTDEKIWQFAKFHSQNNREQLRNDRIDSSKFEKDIFERIKNNKEKEQQKWDDYTFWKQDEHYGVVSFSEIWDSILMWGHYAYNHTGFCVGFFEQKLKDFGYFGGGGPLNYSDTFPSVSPLDEISIQSLFKETHTKASDWSYEKEYRLVKLFFPEAPSIEQRKLKLNKSCFADITIGLKFPKSQVNWISDLAFNLGVKLYGIKQIPFQFKLTREELI